MSYLNSRLHALVAMSLLLLAAPSLLAQDETSVVSTEIRGDVNGDGRVTAADAEAVRAWLVRGTAPAGRDITSVGDANADGRVTAADAALISRFAAGVDVSRFPVGSPIGSEGDGKRIDVAGSLLVEYECTISNRAVSCRPAADRTGAQANVITRAPYVTFTSTVLDSIAGTTRDTLVVSLTMRNDSLPVIGTEDGTTPAASQIFFKSGPVATAGNYYKPRALFVTAANPPALGPANFFNVDSTVSYNNVKYYEITEIIPKGDSASTTATFVYDERVTSFTYTLYIATNVPEPYGTVTVSPGGSIIIAVDSTVQLTAVARNGHGAVKPDAINWTSSNTGVATVNPSTGLVQGVSDGTVTITAASTTVPQRAVGTQTIVVDRFPGVSSTDPADGDVNISPDTTIAITFTEPVNVTTSSFDLKCPSAGSALPYAISGDGTATITLTPNADLPSGTVCEVTVKGNQVTDVDTNDGPNFMPGQYVFDFEIGIQALADLLTSTTTGNVRINTASTSPVFSVTANDKIGPATTITFAGWNAVAGKTQQGGDVVMTMSGAGMGQFTYNPPAGYTGVDSLEYTIASGSATSSAKVALPVSGMIWFVNNAGAACTSRASGCGRLTHPYSTLAAFHAENNGTGNNPAAGDNVFLYESAAAYTGPVALLAQQKLIGQDAGASLSAIAGITPATGSDPLPGMNPGANAVNITGGSGGVVLANIGASSGANNTVRGLSIGTSGGAGLSGTSFGSPVILEVPISVTGGPSLSLNGGTMNSTFATASSSGSSTQGLSLTDVSGSLTFGSGTSLTNSAGTGFFVSGAAPVITYSGGISKNAAIAGRLVEINNVTGGTITFNTGTLSSTSTAGTGISLSNADGAVNFNGTVTLTGGDNGVDIVSGSSGAIDFDAATITNPSGEALRIFNGSGGDQAATVTFDGAIATNAGRPVLIEDVSSGSVAVGASINATAGLGLLVQNNTGGTFTFSHATQALTTGANAAVSLLSNTGATVNFTGGSLVISTAAGAGLNATGGGTVNVTGASNTVSSTGGGTAVNISGTTIGGSGVTLYSVNASGGGSHGIALSNTGAGSFQVTGDGASDGANTTRGRTTAKSGGGTVGITSGGVISGRGGDGINLANTGAVVLRNVAVQNNTGDGIEASGVSGLTLDNLLVSGHANNRGVYASAVSGFTVQHSEIGSNGTSGSAGSSDLWNADLVNGTGSASVTNSNLHTTSEFGLHVLNTSGTLSLSVSNTTVNGVTNGIGVGVYPQGTSNVTANLQGNTVSNNSARGIQVGSGTSSSAVTNVTVNNTQFVNNFVAFDAAHGSGGAFTFSITNNNLQTNVVSSAQAININRQGSPSFGSFGLFSGTISGNTIGTAGVANSGSDVGDGINVESNGSGGITRVAVLNNTIREVGQRGIYLAAVDTDIGGGPAPTLEARVQSNSIANMEAVALDGIQSTLGALSTDNPIICLNISGNTVSAAPRNGIRVRTSGLPASTPTLRLHGWDGVTAPATYFANLNPAATGAVANTNYSLGGGTVSSATCTTP